MRILENLKPERVFWYFEELSRIPRGSGNCAAVSAWCVSVAQSLGLACERDEHDNVIIRKPASVGYENSPAVVLQGHLDMVCEKDPDCPLDMEKEGLSLCTDGEWVWANGTTLGGDNGIAVAMILAILEDNELPHPPLEALFTTDEETGMYGAIGLNGAAIHGRRLINIDSENEGTLTVGCAGGAQADMTIPVKTASNDLPCVQVTVSGLIGGHSGVEIDKGRLNASVTLGHFLQSLIADYRIVSLNGGNKGNVIPREATCVLATTADLTAVAATFAKNNAPQTDPDLAVTVAPVAMADIALTTEDSRRVARFLTTVPNGIVAMSKDIPNLVQTSLNLGVLNLETDKLFALFAVRSSLEADKTALLNTLKEVAESFGGSCELQGYYPAWEYRVDSPLREVMVSTYRRLYGGEPKVEIIHAGLECGLFAEKLAGLDAVSIGPDMQDIHTARERFSVLSAARVYAYVCEILKEMKE